jgi:hypothetical protein
LNRLTASKSTAVAGNDPVTQSLGFTSSSSISQSGLMRSEFPANEDKD